MLEFWFGKFIIALYREKYSYLLSLLYFMNEAIIQWVGKVFRLLQFLHNFLLSCKGLVGEVRCKCR